MLINFKINTTLIIVIILGITMILIFKPKKEFPLKVVLFESNNEVFEATLTNVRTGGLKRKEVGIIFEPPVKWRTEYYSNPFTGQFNVYESDKLIYQHDLTGIGYMIVQDMSSIPSIALKQFPNRVSLGNKTNIKVEIINFKINGEKPNPSTMQLYYSDSRLK